MRGTPDGLYGIDTGYFNAGVVAQEGIVVEAAPVLHWALYRRIDDVLRWAERKRARIDYPEDHVMQTPLVLAYDLEIARPLPLGAKGRPQWSQAHTCGISVLAAWCNREAEPRIYLPGFAGHEAPEVQRFVSDARGLAEGAGHGQPHLVTINGVGFDDPLIAHGCRSELVLTWRALLARCKLVDLQALAGLYGVAQRKGHDLSELTQALAGGLGSLRDSYPVLVDYKEGAKLAVRKGWSLDPMYRATFELAAPTKSMHGSAAPEAWQAGRWAETVSYCVGDAYRTLRLWGHAWAGGELVSASGVRVRLPKEVL